MKRVKNYRNNGINYDLTQDFRFKKMRIKGKNKKNLRKKTLKLYWNYLLKTQDLN